ncbi:hypothetical protein ACHOLT_04945 [Desulfitobacterium sp. Sab5]|uniref:hypothetical protein n=1 Tax=Desulfitobacterium nosdiversum TaxID=3375356 RepID=UPI003CEA3BCB
MHLFLHGLMGYPIIPVYPTFVAAANTAAMTPMSAPSTPPTTAQQLQSIFSESVQAAPRTTEPLTRYGTPQEAARALQSTLRQQWGTAIGGAGGGGSITQKEELQQSLMRRERDILQQLGQMGYPTRVRLQQW